MSQNSISESGTLIIEGNPATLRNHDQSYDDSGKTEIRKIFLKLIRYEDNYQKLKEEIQQLDPSCFKHLWNEIVHLDAGLEASSDIRTKIYPEQIKRFMEIQGHKPDTMTFNFLKKKLGQESFKELEFLALLTPIDRDSLTTKTL